MPEGNKSRASGVGVETALWTPARCQHHLVVFLHIPVGQVLSFIDVDNLYPAPGVQTRHHSHVFFPLKVSLFCWLPTLVITSFLSPAHLMESTDQSDA